jgi:hypothetical protein
MTPNNASSQRKPAAAARRCRQADSALIRPILRPGPPIAPTPAGPGARDHTLRHAGRELSANQAVARLHQTGPLCRPRPAATVKSP